MQTINVFFSYKFGSDEDEFVRNVHFFLAKQPLIIPQRYPKDGEAGVLSNQLREKIKASQYFLFFWGKEIGDIQAEELKIAFDEDLKIIPVMFPGKCEKKQGLKLQLATLLNLLGQEVDRNDIEPSQKEGIIGTVEIGKVQRRSSLRVAEAIVAKMRVVIEGSEEKRVEWFRIDDLPSNYPFNYEKDIIKAYIDGQGCLDDSYVRAGCTRNWPSLEEVGEGHLPNPIMENSIGSYREDSQVLPVTLSDYYKNPIHNPLALGLTFAEAGPRQNHYYPTNLYQTFRVGVLVSGGIAPGINAVISGIVKRQLLHAEMSRYSLEILGYSEGFKRLIYGYGMPHYEILASWIQINEENGYQELSRDFDKCAEEGGSILSSSRLKDLDENADPKERDRHLSDIVNRLVLDGIDILYVIGGDGSMKAAHAVMSYARAAGHNLSVIAIPNTMDNDILWVWQSLGFQSAVEWAKGAIRQMFSEVKANPRVGLIQLFGSDSGFVVNHEALASGVCDLALTPEMGYTMPQLVDYVKKVLQSRLAPNNEGYKSPHCLILMSENAIPTDVESYINTTKLHFSEDEINAVIEFKNNDRRVFGKTSNHLRTAGLKLVSTILQQEIRDDDNAYWRNFEVITSEPRHLIRSVPPSSSDIILGERLGTLAVDGAMAGYTDFMISQWLTEYVMVPLKLVVMGRKRVPSEGIFWKSVIAKTGQPADLTGKCNINNQIYT